MIPRARVPGALRAELEIPGVALPAGRLIAPDPGFAERPDMVADVMWISDAVVDEPIALWRTLRARFPETGLWPVLLESLDGDGRRPWLDGELDPVPLDEVESLAPGEVFAEWWSECADGDEDDDDGSMTAPFGPRFPGLAPTPAGIADQTALSVDGLSLRLGVAAVTRPADVPATIGWTGPVNHTDTARISTALRSWEERFGAELVHLGFAELSLLVARVPENEAEALAVAAEHFAFCPDSVWQGTESVAGLAEELMGAPLWSFWWD